MTRISTTRVPIRKPDSVVFGELAIAAGLAGNPVAVCFFGVYCDRYVPDLEVLRPVRRSRARVACPRPDRRTQTDKGGR